MLPRLNDWRYSLGRDPWRTSSGTNLGWIDIVDLQGGWFKYVGEVWRESLVTDLAHAYINIEVSTYSSSFPWHSEYSVLCGPPAYLRVQMHSSCP
jgi:hypothetical protein